MVIRPRSLPLLTSASTNEGLKHVWTTFSADQVDLNFAAEDVLVEFIEILLFFIREGARIIRLDAIAYLWKEEGTSCVNLPKTHEVVKLLRAMVDYSNFILDYDDEKNAFLDRTDNVGDIYGFYKYSPKTAFFLQYRYADVGYDTAVDKDNKQHFGYGGIQWDTTEKLALSFKAGYQQREYEDEEVATDSDWDGFTFNLRSLYRFTEKTQFSLDAYSRSEESDSSFAADRLVLGVFANYQQRFTDKFSGLIDFRYENSDYSQVVDQDRDDDRYYIKPALRYQFRDWMMTELAYSFDKRESTIDILDYDTNTVILNLTFAM